ncbi:MAG: zinc ribbon domain-containing protein [Gemmatimonadota bacterium]
MPIYEYRCAGCGADFELLVRGDTRIACPSCESRKVDRQLSLPARPAGGSAPADFSKLGPPSGGCHGGGCGCH